jgi:hypothetical protein
MRVHSLIGILAGAAIVVGAPGDAAADLRTNASGRWQYVSALGNEYGRLMGQSALVLQSGSTLATLAGSPLFLGRGNESEDDGNGSWLSSSYVVVLAGLGGGAYLASELIGGDGTGGVGSPNTPPTSGSPTSPTTPTTPTTPTGGPSTSPGPTSTPETTTPEPITMTLLATGLAGMGGVQFRLRRKNSAG